MHTGPSRLGQGPAAALLTCFRERGRSLDHTWRRSRQSRARAASHVNTAGCFPCSERDNSSKSWRRKPAVRTGEGPEGNSPRETLVTRDLLDHVVGIRSRAARAIATERAVNISWEMIREIRDLKAALQTRLPAHDTPVKQQGRCSSLPLEPPPAGTSGDRRCGVHRPPHRTGHRHPTLPASSRRH